MVAEANLEILKLLGIGIVDSRPTASGANNYHT